MRRIIPQWKKLRTRLLFSFFVFLLLPYAVLGLYQITVISRSVIMEQSIETEKADILQISFHVGEYINSIKAVGKDIYFDEDIRQYFTNTYADISESMNSYKELVQPRLSQYLNIKPDITGITIITPKDGIYKNGTEISELSQGTDEWGIYIKTTENPYTCYWLFDTDSSGQQIISMYRLLYSNHYILGLLKISFKTEKLLDLIREQQLDNEVFVISPENIIVSSTQADMIGEPESSMEFNVMRSSNMIDSQVLAVNGVKKLTVTSMFSSNNIFPEHWLIIKTIPEEGILNVINQTRDFQIIIFLSASMLVIISMIIISNNLSNRVTKIVNVMNKVQEGDFNVSVDSQGNDEIAFLSGSFNNMVKRLNELINEVYHLRLMQKEIQLKNREAELYALQRQINPHFLFNTLEAVLAGIKENPDEASEIIQLLAKGFRNMIKRNDDVICLKEELAYIKDYLTVIKYRMKEKLDWYIDIPDELLNVKIPVFTIQPLVENAIYHGISMKKGNGTLRITAKHIENTMTVLIEDDGIGISSETLLDIQASLEKNPEQTDERHIGLRNVYDRIRLFYGEDSSFKIHSNYGNGVQISINVILKDIINSD